MWEPSLHIWTLRSIFIAKAKHINASGLRRLWRQMPPFLPINYYFWKGKHAPLRVKEELAGNEWIYLMTALLSAWESKPIVLTFSFLAHQGIPPPSPQDPLLHPPCLRWTPAGIDMRCSRWCSLGRQSGDMQESGGAMRDTFFLYFTVSLFGVIIPP